MAYQGMWKLHTRSENRQNVQFRYDTEGQLRSVTNEKCETYRFELNSEGEVITETGFDGLTRQYRRNKAGQVEKLLRSDGKATSYEYDACGRVEEVQYYDGKRESYGYDRAGRLIRAVNEQAEVLLERDILGRVTRESSNGHWVESHFDAAGNRSRITSSLGRALTPGETPLAARAKAGRARLSGINSAWHKRPTCLAASSVAGAGTSGATCSPTGCVSPTPSTDRSVTSSTNGT